MKSKTAKHIICFGDSITEAGGNSPEGWTISLQEKLNTSCEGNYIVHNAGIGGNTTALALDRFHTDVLPFLPAMVLIEFGINDSFVNLHTKQNRVTISEFKRKLKEIIRLIHVAGGSCVLLVNHLLNDAKSYKQGNGKSLSANLKPYNKFICELAAKDELAIIDIELAMRKNNVDLEKILQDDGVHLSTHGMQIYAEFVWTELRKLL